jgi:hypothetical protein
LLIADFSIAGWKPEWVIFNQQSTIKNQQFDTFAANFGAPITCSN